MIAYRTTGIICRPGGRQVGKDGFHKQFCFRSWGKHPAVYGKAMAVEFPPPKDIGYRFTPGSALDSSPETCQRRRWNWIRKHGQQATPLCTHGLGQKETGIEIRGIGPAGGNEPGAFRQGFLDVQVATWTFKRLA